MAAGSTDQLPDELLVEISFLGFKYLPWDGDGYGVSSQSFHRCIRNFHILGEIAGRIMCLPADGKKGFPMDAKTRMLCKLAHYSSFFQNDDEKAPKGAFSGS